MAPLERPATGPGHDLLRYLILPSSHRDGDSQRGPSRNTAVNTNMMQVDTPASSLPEDSNPADGHAPLSLDDYLNAHPPPAPKIKPSPAAKSRKTSAPAPTANPVPVAPRAVGARSSKHTIQLHENYQSLGISQPKFVFQGSSVEGWWGKVVFPGLLQANRSANEDEHLVLPDQAKLAANGDMELYESKPLSSKQEAKEKLSEGAIAVLQELEKKGRIVKTLKRKKTKEPAPAQGQTPTKEKEPIINYVGQLLEFQRSTASPQPTYTDYQIGSGFSCLATIEGYSEPFGSLDPPYFPSKKTARQDAARRAVEYFKTAGLWPETFTDAGGIKKKKTNANANANNHLQSDAPTPDSPSTNPDPTASPGTSYAQQVAQLATTLGLPTPQWNLTSVPAAPGFHNATCLFKNSAHAGPIGEVRHIFGKKKAKEECARLTLEYLLGVKEQRMSFGRKMMAGVVGGEGVEGVALRRPLGGDADIEADVMMNNKSEEAQGKNTSEHGHGGENDTDESDVEFEDAVETIDP